MHLTEICTAFEKRRLMSINYSNFIKFYLLIFIICSGNYCA